jgi:hypothetical protein
VTLADEDLVRVTHPFHPLFAQQLPCVGRRYNRHGARLLLQAVDGVIWSVSPQWTDLASKDPELVMGDGRAVLRFSDLLELADLVTQISDKSAQTAAQKRKDNYAAYVRQITPQGVPE